MTRALSMPRRRADASLHPIQAADRRLADVRRQALYALCAVAAAPMVGAAGAIISILMLAGRP